MAWVAVNWNGDEYIFEAFPERLNCVWAPTFCEYENRVYDYVELPKGALRSSSEENCLGKMSQLNFKKNSYEYNS